jgi:hypothetical protein
MPQAVSASGPLRNDGSICRGTNNGCRLACLRTGRDGVFARELRASSDWYEHLWHRRERIAGIPMLLLWGMQGPAFTPDALERWERAFSQRPCRPVPGCRPPCSKKRLPRRRRRPLAAFCKVCSGRKAPLYHTNGTRRKRTLRM